MSAQDRRKVILLGHTGFLGRALEESLQKDFEVHGYSSKAMDLRRPESLKPLEGLVDEETVVIHLSSITRDRGDTLETLTDNISMVGNVGEFLRSHPPGKFVYVSSDAVYPMQEGPISESTPVKPDGTLYSVGKYAGECLVWNLLGPAGVPILNLRPTTVFGPGDTHNAYGPNRFARSLAQDREIHLFGQGEEMRDHLYIDDAVRLISRLMSTDATGTYNLATGKSPSFGEVADAFKKIVPDEFKVIHAPRKDEVTHRHFDVTHLSRQVPDFEFTDWEQGLRATFEFFSA